MSSSKDASGSDKGNAVGGDGDYEPKNNAFGMAIVLGLVACSAGFTMYTKRSSQMINQINRVTKRQGLRKPKRKPGPMTKEEWDKVRPRIDKDDMF